MNKKPLGVAICTPGGGNFFTQLTYLYNVCKLVVENRTNERPQPKQNNALHFGIGSAGYIVQTQSGMRYKNYLGKLKARRKLMKMKCQ